ncbi:hypothetical protein LguiB_004860 [Lonicera macranthoides]
MVFLSQQVLLDIISFARQFYANSPPSDGIPIIDLSAPNAKTLVVEACEEFGFFKVVNHGVSMELVTQLESEAVKFFNSSQDAKNRAGPPNPFGSLVNEYVAAVTKTASKVLELIADGLNIEPRNVLSRLVSDERSDSFFRLNHYPPNPSSDGCANMIGFGEHTDPQIISLVRSNNTSGLEISLKDGTWLPVPPDPFSFFVNVDDCLQVMTNGRFRSVKHRVVAESSAPRMSMIYFGGPPLTEKIATLPSLLEGGEKSLYKEFTWMEYKKSAYNTRN